MRITFVQGSQMKTIEDDPSITPGSVARSPLSIAAKEADLFAPSSKTSPTDLPPLSLSSSTWSFNPSGSNQPHFTRYFSFFVLDCICVFERV